MKTKQIFSYATKPGAYAVVCAVLWCAVSVYAMEAGAAGTTSPDAVEESSSAAASSEDGGSGGGAEEVVEEAAPAVTQEINDETDAEAPVDADLSTSELTSSSLDYTTRTESATTSSDGAGGEATSSPPSSSESELTTTSTTTATSSVPVGAPAISSDAGGSTTSPSSTSSTTPTIESGTAVAMANVLNIVNSNFVNSDGVVFFSNFIEAITEVLDFRALYAALANASCSLLSCDSASTTVEVSNAALIQNLLLLQAQSGANTIAGGGSGTIATGDAYAGLNLINIANMNFVDSNYLLVTMNAFSDVNTDIVFPSADALFSSLAGTAETTSIALTGNATVDNNLSVEAGTGGNTLDTANGGTISSGGATATTNVFNQLNSTLIGGQQVTILFRIHGDWVGEVFGAPDDLLWYERPDGGVMLFDQNSDGGISGIHSGSLTVTGDQTAHITNDVQVVALTGENRITGTETGLITTGDAYAGANIVNIANGNVIGRNWVLAIINIFGDFRGNIAFGRPDLWVGEIIDAPTRLRNGDTLSMALTVINNGDSPATNVVLEDAFDARHLTITSASLPYTTTNGVVRFNLDRIPPGGAVEVTYEAMLSGTKAGQELTNTATVKSRETDNNLADNTETVTTKTYQQRGGGSVRVRELRDLLTNLTTASSTATTTRDAIAVKRVFPSFPLSSTFRSMRQVLIVRNPTDHVVKGVTFADIVQTNDGEVIHTELWDLGDIAPYESIELGYTLSFGSSAAPGTYRLFSRVRTAQGGEDMHENGTVVLKEDGAVAVAPPSLVPYVAGWVATATDGAHEDWVRSAWLLGAFAHLESVSDMLLGLPGLHSESTSPNNHIAHLAHTWSDWLDRVYGYLTTLFAPAIAQAESVVRSYKP